jgi:predicted DNA-binding transcriptional regulator YafY
LDEQYRTTLTGLNKLEVQSLFVASNDRALRDVGLSDAAQGLLMKLLAALPLAQHSTADHIRQRLMIDSTWWWHDATTPAFFDELQRAVYDDRLIETVYENYAGEIVRRVLAPYSLICKSSLWYLLAERDGELHTYRVTRFHAVHLLDQSFSRRPDFDLPTYWQAHLQDFVDVFSEYRCTLRVHPLRIPFVKQMLPGRWEVLAGADEVGWVTLSIILDSDVLARMLVFGLAGFVQVVEPVELKESVLAQAGLLLEHLTP